MTREEIQAIVDTLEPLAEGAAPDVVRTYWTGVRDVLRQRGAVARDVADWFGEVMLRPSYSTHIAPELLAAQFAPIAEGLGLGMRVHIPNTDTQVH